MLKLEDGKYEFDKLYNPIQTPREYYIVYDQKKFVGILVVFNDVPENKKPYVLRHMMYNEDKENLICSISELETILKK